MFVIYDIETTKIVTLKRGGVKYYQSMRTAKAALTRAERDGTTAGNQFGIAEVEHYHTNIEKKKTVKNLISGEDVEISVNTPRCCDPSSEAYWSM